MWRDQVRVRSEGQLRSRDTGSLVGSEEFRYDPAGNRLDFNARQFAKSRDNRITHWRDQEYRYDPWGNLIEKCSEYGNRLQRFGYDGENRLVRAETWVNGKLESTGHYRYDSLGRRVAKLAEINGQVEQKRFLWQGLRMLREETPGQSILYLYEPGSYAPLARVDQAEGEEQKLYYFHTDQIGTPLEVTDSDGKIVWQATYRSWGAIESLPINEIEQNLRFQGQYFDSETGLHYNTFRYYDSEVGKYISHDPIGLLGGINLYQYAPNPVSWLDPLGWITYNTMPAIDGFQKHHIIPQQLSNHAAMQAGEVNIHKLSNIIYLPKYEENHPVRTVHRGSHAQYNSAVEKKLDIIHEYGKKNGWTKADYQKAIHGVMVDERKGLRAGKTMLNKNSVRGATCG